MIEENPNLNAPIPREIGNFQFLKIIGNGSFSSVYLAQNKLSRDTVAIKCIPKSRINDEKSRLRLIREVSLLRQLDHPMVAQLFAYLSDKHYHYLVLEYANNGSLHSFVSTQGKLPEMIARRYFTQVLSILEYLHKEKHVAHRDMKAENILLDKYHNIRLIDFGLSNIFTESRPLLESRCGSPAYLAPEIIKGSLYSASADIWSTGVLLYMICVGKLPFEDSSQQLLFNKIIVEEPFYPPYLSASLVDFLKKMLTKLPECRITIDQIKKHPWFSPMEYESLQKFLSKNVTTLPINNKNITMPSKHQSHLSQNFDVGDIHIDTQIVEMMSASGIDVSSLKQNLFTHEDDDVSVIYSIKKKAKITDMMKYASRPSSRGGNVIAKTSTPQPTSVPIRANYPELPSGSSLTKFKRNPNNTLKESNDNGNCTNNNRNNNGNNDLKSCVRPKVIFSSIAASQRIRVMSVRRPCVDQL